MSSGSRAEKSAIAGLLILAAALGWQMLRPDAPVAQPVPSSPPQLAAAPDQASLPQASLPRAISLPPPPPPPPPALTVAAPEPMPQNPAKTTPPPAPPPEKPTKPVVTLHPLVPVAAPAAAPKPDPVALTPMQPEPESEAPMEQPKTQPTVQPRPEPAPQPELSQPQPGPLEPSLSPDPATIRTGRALLRLLEHDQGPSIQIAWPDQAQSREALYATLTRCYGMQSLLMDSQGGLYGETGQPGHPTQPDLARVSGFLRAAEGRLTRAEESALAPIRARHGRVVRAAMVVRAFPRQADAVMLGGLSALLGGSLSKDRIDATYRLDGTVLSLIHIHRNGAAVEGRISLGSASRCGGTA